MAAGVNRALNGLGTGSAAPVVIGIVALALACGLFVSAQRRPVTAGDA